MPDTATVSWSIASLTVENFKSYHGNHKISFHDAQFASIIGTNGSGKSNLMDAISFVLGVTNQFIRSETLGDLIYQESTIADEFGEEEDDHHTHGTGKHSAKSAFVLLELVGPQNAKLSIKRMIRRAAAGSGNPRLLLYVDDAQCADEEAFVDALAARGIRVPTKNFLVFQGDVESLALEEPKHLAKKLEIISGSYKYVADYDRLLTSLSDVKDEFYVASERKKDLTAQLKILQNQIAEKNRYDQMTKDLATKNVELALWELHQIEDQIHSKRNSIVDFNMKMDAIADQFDNVKKLRAQQEKEDTRGRNLLRKLDKEAKNLVVQINILEEKRSQLEDLLADNNAQADENKALQAKLQQMIDEHQERNMFKRQRDVDLARSELQNVNRKYEESLKDSGCASLTGPQEKAFDALMAEFEAQNKKLFRVRNAFATNLQIQNVKLKSAQLSKDQLNTTLTNVLGEAKRLQIEHDECKQRKLDCLARISKLQKERQSLHGQKSDHEAEMAKLVAQVEDTKKYLNQQEVAKQDLAAIAKQEQAIEDLMQRFPGKVLGRFGDIATWDKKYNAAIRETIGTHFNSLLVDTSSTAHKCIQSLKEWRARPMSFIPIDTITAPDVDRTRTALSGIRGVRLARTCVNCDPKYLQAAEFVCGNVIICDTLDIAADLKYEKRINQKMISLKGEVIHSNNTLTGGTARSEERLNTDSAVAYRKKENQYAGLVKQLKEMYDDKSLDSAIESLEKKIEKVTLDSNSFGKELDQIGLMIKSCEKDESHTKALLQETNAEIAEIELRIVAISNDRQEVEDKINTLKKDFFAEFCEEVGVDDIELIEAAQTSAKRAHKRALQNAQENLSLLESYLGIEEKKLEKMAERLSEAKQKENELAKIQNDLSQQMKAVTSELENVTKKQDHVQNKSESERGHVDEVKEKARAAEDSYKSSKKDLDQYRVQVLEITSSIATLKRSFIARLQKAKYDNVNVPLQSAKSLMDVEFPDQSQTAGVGDVMEVDEADSSEDEDDADDSTFFDQHNVDYSSIETEGERPASKIRSLKKEIEELSESISNTEVNIKAGVQLEEVERSLELAQTAYEEKLALQRDLQKQFNTVRDLRSSLFNDMYLKVKEEIGEIYKQLTATSETPAGGHAELSAFNDAEPYLEGVTYSATPPVKRYKEISSLSGGEKTMAALALIFSLHRVQPTPFFILDEVDAALDNSNVANVVRFIQQNKTNSQFVVISLKSSFFEHSDVLVGVYKDLPESTSQTLELPLQQLVDEIDQEQSNAIGHETAVVS